MTYPHWVFVYDRASGKERYRFLANNGRSGGVGTVTFTPDGKQLVTLVEVVKNRRTEDLHARITEAAHGKLLRVIPLRDGQWIHEPQQFAVSDKVLVVVGTKEAAAVYEAMIGQNNPPGQLRAKGAVRPA